MSCGKMLFLRSDGSLSQQAVIRLSQLTQDEPSKRGVMKKLPMDLSPVSILLLYWLFCFNKITEQS